MIPNSIPFTDTNQLFSWGYNQYGQLGLGHTTPQTTMCLIPSIQNIVDITTGGYHSMAIDSFDFSWKV